MFSSITKSALRNQYEKKIFITLHSIQNQIITIKLITKEPDYISIFLINIYNGTGGSKLVCSPRDKITKDNKMALTACQGKANCSVAKQICFKVSLCSCTCGDRVNHRPLT